MSDVERTYECDFTAADHVWRRARTEHGMWLVALSWAWIECRLCPFKLSRATFVLCWLALVLRGTRPLWPEIPYLRVSRSECGRRIPIRTCAASTANKEDIRKDYVIDWTNVCLKRAIGWFEKDGA